MAGRAPITLNGAILMQRRTTFLFASLALAFGLGLGASASAQQASPLPDPGCSETCRIEFGICLSIDRGFRVCKAERIQCQLACGLNG